MSSAKEGKQTGSEKPQEALTFVRSMDPGEEIQVRETGPGRSSEQDSAEPLSQSEIETQLVRSGSSSEATTHVKPADFDPAEKQSSLPGIGIGSIIKDRFVVEGLLGRGGMGVVYRVRDLRKEETKDRNPFVALKVLGEDFRRDQTMVIAMQREARKAQTLAHPAIATVYDFDREGELVFLTMEMLEGEPLDEFIDKHPDGVGLERARAIIRGLCLGLAYAHNKNIIHSDFKPGNVFLTPDDRAKILDFGIARAAPVQNIDEDSQQTQFDAGVLGSLTPAYASIDMFAGGDPHPADDVYALALVSYQLLTGKHPFGFKPSFKAKQKGMVPAPIRGLKRREWRAIERGLAFDRSERSDHAAAFLREFEGSPRTRLALAGVASALVLTSSYLVYEESRKVIDNRPDTPFSQLLPGHQEAFNRRLEEGDFLRGFDDFPSALVRYQQAYELHPKNPRAVEALEKFFLYYESTLSADDSAGRQNLADTLQQVRNSDAYLTNLSSLKAMAERLESNL